MGVMFYGVRKEKSKRHFSRKRKEKQFWEKRRERREKEQEERRTRLDFRKTI